jgi:phosphatidate cytidylyltransferase
MLALALALVALFASALARYRAPGKNIENLGAEVFILFYVGVFISLTVQLRWIDPTVLHYVPLASLVVAVKCGDTCAYFAGRYLGKTKLSPLISPGKTWEGAIAGVCGAALGSWLWLTFGVSWLTNAVPGSWYWSVLYGALLGIVGIIGDLAESLIKRDVGAKDSAPLLPGFGGVLDLLDSILFTAPIAYLLWLVLPLV